jgi:hypothetical protein
MDFRDDSACDSVMSNATMVFAFIVAAWEYARAISLVVYMVLIGLEAAGDMWNIFIYIEVGMCLFAGFLYTTMGAPGEGVLPVTHMFTLTPFVVMMAFVGLFALRYLIASTTCPMCPTYVETGLPNCLANPYAPNATLNWRSFDTYNRETIIENTLAKNPTSDIRDRKILNNIERCWTIGCSECTDTYEWRHLLTLGTLTDVLVNAALGLVLANIR